MKPKAVRRREKRAAKARIVKQNTQVQAEKELREMRKLRLRTLVAIQQSAANSRDGLASADPGGKLLSDGVVVIDHRAVTLSPAEPAPVRLLLKDFTDEQFRNKFFYAKWRPNLPMHPLEHLARAAEWSPDAPC